MTDGQKVVRITAWVSIRVGIIAGAIMLAKLGMRLI